MPLIIYPPGLYKSPNNENSFANSDTLSRLSTDDNGNLAFNGKTVGEKSLEVAYNLTLSKQNISTKSFELPHDCDTSRSITLALQGISTQQNIDWVVLEHNSPELDVISWSGFALQDVAQEGDAVLVTYYKKI